MKKFICVFVFTLFLISCSKSDNNTNGAAVSIVGKWEIDQAGAIDNGTEVDVAPFLVNRAGCPKIFHQFFDDGKYNLASYAGSSGCNFGTPAVGTWTKDGNIIKISGGNFATFEIVTLTDTKMKVKFKNPSIINEYTDTFYLTKK